MWQREKKLNKPKVKRNRERESERKKKETEKKQNQKKTTNFTQLFACSFHMAYKNRTELSIQIAKLFKGISIRNIVSFYWNDCMMFKQKPWLSLRKATIKMEQTGSISFFIYPSISNRATFYAILVLSSF